MMLNADFAERVTVHSASLPWLPSPMPGVERRMLERMGGEVARATSVVRYAPGSIFPPHVHGGGEELLVLDGVFSDERGDYPVGAYVRNPPKSGHTPGSRGGCVIFVKLWQFDPADRADLRVDLSNVASRAAVERVGVHVQQLFEGAQENVRVETWAPGIEVRIAAAGGLEAFVLEGSFEEGGENFCVGSWLRLPADTDLEAQVGSTTCRVYVKSGHLLHVRSPI